MRLQLNVQRSLIHLVEIHALKVVTTQQQNSDKEKPGGIHYWFE